jgi:hypothetical protein
MEKAQQTDNFSTFTNDTKTYIYQSLRGDILVYKVLDKESHHFLSISTLNLQNVDIAPCEPLIKEF